MEVDLFLFWVKPFKCDNTIVSFRQLLESCDYLHGKRQPIRALSKALVTKGRIGKESVDVCLNTTSGSSLIRRECVQRCGVMRHIVKGTIPATFNGSLLWEHIPFCLLTLGDVTIEASWKYF